MTYTEAKDYIHNHPEIFLSKAKKKGYICPLCGNGTGVSGDGLVTKDKIHFKCFKCNFYGDIINLIGEYYNLTSHQEIFKKAYEIYQIDITSSDITKKTTNKTVIIETYNHTEESLEYLNKRGLTLDTIKKYNINYSKDSNSVIIPYNHEGTYNITRNIKDKVFRKPKSENGQTEPLFYENQLYREEPIFIVESAICALSIKQYGYQSIALNGTGFLKLINYLEKNISAVSTSGFILLLDNDEVGKDISSKLKEELQKTEFSKFSVIEYIFENNVSLTKEVIKDPNEYLVTKGSEEFITQLNKALITFKECSQREILSYTDEVSLKAFLPDYVNYIKNAKGEVSTGFANLDEALDGGLLPGLVILGAMSSLGKTTFLLQVARQIASKGTDVLFFSLEMSKHELLAKVISSIAYENGIKIKTKQAMTFSKYTEIPEQVIEAVPYNLYIYDGEDNKTITHIGADFIEEKTKEFVAKTNRKPVIVVDYLQILKPLNMRLTDKQNTDLAVYTLKRLSRQLDIPVVAISSLNRENYASSITLRAFKESGAIEYSSDLLLGLQFKDMIEDKTSDYEIERLKSAEIREITLKVLKNRNGKSIATADFNYHATYNIFEELGKSNSLIARSNTDPNQTKLQMDITKKSKAVTI